MAAFYVLVPLLVALGALPWPSLVVVGALPVLRKVWPVFDRPPPSEPPPRYPIWPLWYAPHAFVHTRRAGSLFVLGLAVAAIFKI